MLPSNTHTRLLLLLLAPSVLPLPPQQPHHSPYPPSPDKVSPVWVGDGGAWSPTFAHPQHLHYVYVPLETTRKKNEFATRQQLTSTSCDGMTNIVHDLTVVSLFTGVIGTVLSVFTASYTSVLSNAISTINAVLSLLIGVPSAVLTYLAASDRLSYTTANLLSLLSFANTAFGALSIDFGNKDIFTSQLANVIGIFSLTLSVITAFPEALLPPTITSVASFLQTHPAPLRRFVKNYGCYGSPTFYDVIDNFLRRNYGSS